MDSLAERIVQPPFPLVNSPLQPGCEICVIIPARDEAKNIGNTLQALAHQQDLQGRVFPHHRYEIILLANNCSDDTAELAREFGRSNPDLILHVVEINIPPEQAGVARARQLLMDEAYRRLQKLGRRGVIASTDADTRVAPEWLAATLHELGQGADAVGGRILVDLSELHPKARTFLLRDVGYRHLTARIETILDPKPHNPWPRHYQHFGASLAMTAEVYGQVGGMPNVKTLEDVFLYKEINKADAQFRHSPLVRVTTSARTVGRVPVGLAMQLDTWVEHGEQGQSWNVEQAAAIETRLRGRRQFRLLWQKVQSGQEPAMNEISRVAEAIGVDVIWLCEALSVRQTFGVLNDKMENYRHNRYDWSKQWSFIPIEQAIWEMRLLLNRLYQQEQTQEPRLIPLQQIQPVTLLASAS